MKGIKAMVATKKALPLLAFFALTLTSEARVVKGKIRDAQTGEEIIGARVEIKGDPSKAVVSGLDGSFNLNVGEQTYTLVCTYMGYQPFEIQVNSNNENIEIPLVSKEIELRTVTVSAHNPGRTEAGARLIERNAPNVVNVMSAKAIELSPDITVANVIQRMSGVTVEKNDNGEGQYAILRGMDKRYNYTLVNGIKIPSPDNKNRFVPLDIFPSEMLDRLEVTKSLTADMEGDGIGGAINMVMKDAPLQRQLDANFSIGYNAQYFDRDFESFHARGVMDQSPYERFGADHRTSMTDFKTDHLKLQSRTPMPDLTGGITYGDRFFGERLGLMVSANVQNTYRGKNSDIYYMEGKAVGTQSVTDRTYSEQLTRMGAHMKLDLQINPHNELEWYNGYILLRSGQVRDVEENDEETVRMKLNRQGIFNSTLSGTHKIAATADALKIDWKATFGKATNKTPDNTVFSMKTAQSGAQFADADPGAAARRRWEHNSDRDLAAYLNLGYTWKWNDGKKLLVKAGGMYRDKDRESFFNEYKFNAERNQRRGEDWNNFDEIVLTFYNRDISNPLNYDAYERIGAAYAMGVFTTKNWEVNAGIRAEHTDQGYDLAYASQNKQPEGNQKYTDWLPSFHLKWHVHRNANLRFSYSEAINRPSFFEIVPYHIINEDYNEVGNPDLKHTIAHNLDLRYEFFPSAMDQFMIGAFYKFIQDPIEYGLTSNSGQDTNYGPQNYGDARNLGIEVDIMKYFSWIGIKANYTYTHSEITTDKWYYDRATETISTRRQSRPLFGQAAHVANITLLFKDTKYQWNGQLAFNYTGKRIASLSQYYDDDIWEAGRPSLDASVEKGFRHGFTLFAKGSNLLNLPVVRYYHANDRRDAYKDNWKQHDGGIMEREEKFGQSFMVGVRFKL